MEIFNIDFVKEIIHNYFSIMQISHYIYYNDSFYYKLSQILNAMLECPHYSNNCYLFFENYKMINLDRLLDKYSVLLEYQVLLPFIYEILLIMQTVDYYNISVTDKLLIELLETDPKFSFMLSTVEEIKNQMDVDDITNQFRDL